MKGADFLETLVALIGEQDAKRCALKFGAPDEEFHAGVTNAEALAFYVYSASVSWHVHINQALWSGSQDHDIRIFAQTLNAGLAKLAPYRTNGGTVYRGYDDPDLVAFQEAYRPGKRVTFHGFTSAAYRAESAFGGNVLFTIRSLSARVIYFLSATFVEEEVLFPSGCRFEVIAAELREGRMAVLMQEVPSP